MKVHDIIEGYGMRVGTAANTKAMSDPVNQTKRANNRAADGSREANIAQQHSYRSQKRKRVAPTGVPSRFMQPQTPASPEGEQQ